MSKNKKKKEYPRFNINRLKKEWPFSLKLAEDLFKLNRYAVYSSLRDFFVFTALDLYVEDSDSSGEDTYFSNSDKNKKIEEMGIWNISQYPGFFIKNNRVHYKETIKSKVQNSTREELTSNIYTLDHISYETFLFEGTKFYINSFFQGSVVYFDFDVVGINLLSLTFIWSPVFNYLLWTTCSSSMKNMLENQNYRKSYEKEILKTFYGEFQRIKRNPLGLNKILLRIERSVLEERLLNVFLFSGISENNSKTLVTNFFLTENLDEVLSFYQELLSQFKN